MIIEQKTYYFTIPSDIEDCCVAEYLRNLIQNKIKLNVYTEREEALFVANAKSPRVLLMKVDDGIDEFHSTQVYSEKQDFICFGSGQYFKDNCEVWE